MVQFFKADRCSLQVEQKAKKEIFCARGLFFSFSFFYRRPPQILETMGVANFISSICIENASSLTAVLKLVSADGPGLQTRWVQYLRAEMKSSFQTSSALTNLSTAVSNEAFSMQMEDMKLAIPMVSRICGRGKKKKEEKKSARAAGPNFFLCLLL